jgi:hypothetical protein
MARPANKKPLMHQVPVSDQKTQPAIAHPGLKIKPLKNLLYRNIAEGVNPSDYLDIPPCELQSNTPLIHTVKTRPPPLTL